MSGSNSSVPASALAHEPLAEPLQFSVHGLPTPDVRQEQRTKFGRVKMLLVLAVCAAPVVASYFTYFVIRPQGRSNYAELIEPQRRLPAALPLRGLDGQAVDALKLKGQWLLVVVGSGACDGVCERRLYLQRQLREMLGGERDRVDKVWLIADEAPLRVELRDTLARSAAPVKILRAPREALARWLAPAPGHQLEDHVYIVDPMGNWMMRTPVDPDPAKLKRDLDRLLRASASWDRAGR